MALGITHRVWSIGDLTEVALAAVPTKPTLHVMSPPYTLKSCRRARRGWKVGRKLTLEEAVKLAME